MAISQEEAVGVNASDPDERSRANPRGRLAPLSRRAPHVFRFPRALACVYGQMVLSLSRESLFAEREGEEGSTRRRRSEGESGGNSYIYNRISVYLWGNLRGRKAPRALSRVSSLALLMRARLRRDEKKKKRTGFSRFRRIGGRCINYPGGDNKIVINFPSSRGDRESCARRRSNGEGLDSKRWGSGFRVGKGTGWRER